MELITLGGTVASSVMLGVAGTRLILEFVFLMMTRGTAPTDMHRSI